MFTAADFVSGSAQFNLRSGPAPGFGSKKPWPKPCLNSRGVFRARGRQFEMQKTKLQGFSGGVLRWYYVGIEQRRCSSHAVRFPDVFAVSSLSLHNNKYVYRSIRSVFVLTVSTACQKRNDNAVGQPAGPRWTRCHRCPTAFPSQIARWRNLPLVAAS